VNGAGAINILAGIIKRRGRHAHHIASKPTLGDVLMATPTVSRALPGTKLRAVLAAGVLSALTACTYTRYADLYPDNDVARTLSAPLQFKIEGHGNGNGTAEMWMPDGEYLTGRYSIIAGGGVSVASAFVDGRSAMRYGLTMSGEGGGVADMRGPKTTAHCEFENNNMTGHGNGVCRLSSGALYRMQY
jgi:hypothetical protein